MDTSVFFFNQNINKHAKFLFYEWLAVNSSIWFNGNRYVI